MSVIVNAITQYRRGWLVFALLLYSGLSLAQTNQFTGTFSLPNGQVAPSGGVVYELRTNPLDEFTYNSLVAYSSTQITIPAGQSSADYALRLDNSPPEFSKALEFECIARCQSLDVTSTGWWNSVDGVVGLADASTYLANSNQVINITLQAADMFSGEIVFPEGFSANGMEQFSIEVKDSSFAPSAVFIQVLNAQTGANTVAFSLAVPSSQAGGGWNLNVACQGCDADIAAGPYYPKSISAQPVSLVSSGQYFYQVENDYSGLVFDLISLREPEVESPVVIPAINLLLLTD